MKYVALYVLILVLLAAPFAVVHAQGDIPTGGPTGGSPAQPVSINLPNLLGQDCDFQCVTVKVIDGLLSLAIPIVAIMVLIGGIQIATAGGSEEKYKKGTKTVLYAVLGFAAILVSKGVVLIIEDLLGVKK